jgi:phosphoribosylformimino-5-aminoimidazole carboxamide ribotide isomerase
MNIYPAIDLYEGQVVRLTKGDFAQKKVYSDSPADTAKQFESQGAAWIHMVDLEGAKTGILKNISSLARVRKAVKCRLQFGGGMRSLEAIQQAFEAGADRVVLGTKALDPAFFSEVLKLHKSRIAVGIDIKDNQVQTQGWLQASSVSLEQALELFDKHGVETLIYTDIQKDGMLQGPNFERLEFILRNSKARIILSGGVGNISDIEKCAAITEKNFEGVIAGKAIYEKTMDLREAVLKAGGKK